MTLPIAYAVLLVAIVAEVIATSALNASEGFTRLTPSIITFVGYAVAFFCLAQTVRIIPVGVAYAIWSGIGIVLIAAIGWLWFRQTLDLAAMLGIALILAGVLVINLVSTSVGH
jgi:small multidrug resistance pump